MANQRKGGAVRKTNSIWPNMADTSGEKGVLIQPIPAYELTASPDPKDPTGQTIAPILRKTVTTTVVDAHGVTTTSTVVVPDPAGARPHPSNTERLEEGLTKASVEYMGRRSKRIAADSPGGAGTFEPRVGKKFGYENRNK
jgi:hypothetical protein